MSTPTFDLSALINGLATAMNSFISLLGQLLPFIITIGLVVGVVGLLTSKISGIAESVTGAFGGGGVL